MRLSGGAHDFRARGSPRKHEKVARPGGNTSGFAVGLNTLGSSTLICVKQLWSAVIERDHTKYIIMTVTSTTVLILQGAKCERQP